MTQFKSCFCNGSCKVTGVCGEINMIGPGILEYPTPMPEYVQPKPKKQSVASQMAELTEQSKKREEEELLKRTDKYYSDCLGFIKVTASKGKNNLDYEVSEYVDYEIFIQRLKGDGFKVQSTLQRPFGDMYINISW